MHREHTSTPPPTSNDEVSFTIRIPAHVALSTDFSISLSPRRNRILHAEHEDDSLQPLILRPLDTAIPPSPSPPSTTTSFQALDQTPPSPSPSPLRSTHHSTLPARPNDIQHSPSRVRSQPAPAHHPVLIRSLMRHSSLPTTSAPQVRNSHCHMNFYLPVTQNRTLWRCQRTILFIRVLLAHGIYATLCPSYHTMIGDSIWCVRAQNWACSGVSCEYLFVALCTWCW